MCIEDFLPDNKPIAKPGQKVAGRYIVERELARGGMAHILLAQDTLLNTPVALKVLPPALAKNKKAIEEIKEEARITMSLNHPNIVKLHQFEDTPEYKFLVMEYVDGPSLADVVDEKGKLTLEEALGYMQGACAALDYAHSEGIVHRDIKSANFLISSRNVIKLADFGIAQKVRRALSKITQKQVMGTIPYMSPEQLMGHKIDHHSDIYSLGAVLYELLSGLPPFFSGGIEAQIILKVPDLIPEVPKHINNAIIRALKKSPAHRWRSAADFYRALIDEPATEKLHAQPELQWPERKSAPAARGRHFRILAVDDEEDIRAVIQAVLAAEGYEVHTALDGQDALEKVAKTSYDLLILDILMPRMDGIQFLSRFRNGGFATPVLMLTALGDEKHMLESYRSGADYYMVKPFSKKRLVAASRYLMDDFTQKEKSAIEQLL